MAVNLIHFDQKESHSEVDESSIVYFKLPESFDKMSEDELTDFFTEKTEDEISKLAEEIPQGSLALRWCTTKALYSYCGFKFDYNCNHNRKRILYRQYCEGQGEVYYWSWGGCC